MPPGPSPDGTVGYCARIASITGICRRIGRVWWRVDRWLTVSKQTRSLGPSAQRFVDDLRAGRNLHSWAKVNVEQMLPFRSQTPRTLMLVRAGGLFLPILLTWLSLSQVIGPFALYIQNQQSSANFLWFWESNPGGSFAGHWELGHVALTAAAVLAFLTVLAMRISWWETTKSERGEAAYADLLAALEAYFAPLR